MEKYKRENVGAVTVTRLLGKLELGNYTSEESPDATTDPERFRLALPENPSLRDSLDALPMYILRNGPKFEDALRIET